jgi:quinol monooxygenase YgiN
MPRSFWIITGSGGILGDMMIVTLHLRVLPEKRLDMLKTIHAAIGPTDAQSGCIGCELFNSTQNDDSLLLMEKWQSREDLYRHIKTPEFRKIMVAMDSACEPPEISFSECGLTEGMELVERILGGNER